MKTNPFENPSIVSREQWLTARRELLRDEKEFTRLQDRLNARRRSLPWVKIEKPYTFEAPDGRVSLAELFAGRSQLIVQHFMFGLGWEEGCKSCSFMMDHFAPTVVHLTARDIAFAAISHAPLREILPFQQRMGWNVNWVSSHDSDFNHDYQVSFTPEELAAGHVHYNYTAQAFPHEEAPGVSAFARDDNGAVYHTYSTYGRGVEFIMDTYRLIDLVPKGRAEEGMAYGMEWLRHHDRYEPASTAS